MKIHFFDMIQQVIYRGRMYHEATTAGGLERLQQGEQSDYSRGSEATTEGGAKRLQQGEQSNYSRGSEATTVGGAKRLQ
jgi:hypothetical protein